MILRHVGAGQYATGEHVLRLDMTSPDPAERGWSIAEIVKGEPYPVGPIFRTRPEALAWLARSA